MQCHGKFRLGVTAGARSWTLGLVVLILSACVGRPLMPTPNLYVDSELTPFSDVPPALQSNEIDLLYLTDREPETDEAGNLRYGYGRSRSLAFGSAMVRLGEDMTWSELVQMSESPTRSRQIEVNMSSITELGRYPGTPGPFTIAGGRAIEDPDDLAKRQEVADAFHRELRRRLELTSRKDVYFYIHGYHNDFENAAFAAAELWHFAGREGVPIFYTWPAGAPGLFGYIYDRESGEFTVHHLKMAIRHISSWPEVERIHFVAHSRGTDVTLSALRELFIEAWGGDRNPREEFRIANLVLAAPDLDIGVVDQRIIAEHLVAGLGRLTVYSSPDDKAIGIAESLFSSPRGRVGRLERQRMTELISPVLASHERSRQASFIQFSGKSDELGHSYFRTNPAVASDLILLLRYGYPPGSPQRPLVNEGLGFWRIPEGYPAQVDDG